MAIASLPILKKGIQALRNWASTKAGSTKKKKEPSVVMDGSQKMEGQKRELKNEDMTSSQRIVDPLKHDGGA